MEDDRRGGLSDIGFDDTTNKKTKGSFFLSLRAYALTLLSIGFALISV